jgi:hypothetical protein
VALRGHQQDLSPRHPLHGTFIILINFYFICLLIYLLIALFCFYLFICINRQEPNAAGECLIIAATYGTAQCYNVLPINDAASSFSIIAGVRAPNVVGLELFQDIDCTGASTQVRQQYSFTMPPGFDNMVTSCTDSSHLSHTRTTAHARTHAHAQHDTCVFCLTFALLVPIYSQVHCAVEAVQPRRVSLFSKSLYFFFVTITVFSLVRAQYTRAYS